MRNVHPLGKRRSPSHCFSTQNALFVHGALHASIIPISLERDMRMRFVYLLALLLSPSIALALPINYGDVVGIGCSLLARGLLCGARPIAASSSVIA